jgi:hypothetical protein
MFTQPPVSGLGQFPAVMNLSALNGVNGFELYGGVDDRAGNSISAAGDVNKDGIADIIVGAYYANSSIGKTYVVFGKAGAWTSSISLGMLDGANGFELDGMSTYEQSGYSVSVAGDINKDGIADILIGARQSSSRAGKTYVVFGKSTAWTSPLSLSTLDGNNGFALDGVSAYEESGYSVSVAGDINKDGIADMLIGAPGANSGAGKTYVVFGKANGWDSPFFLSTLNGTNGFALDGVAPQDNSGSSVSAAGDINNDGIADIIIGAPYANAEAGKTYVVFGKASGWTSSILLDMLDGANGFALDGAEGHSGTSVSAGDVNSDGIADILIGAPSANSYAGKTYVVFGKADGWTSPPSLGTLDGNNGFVLDGVSSYEESGTSVSAAGDVNNDGIADILIGASGANAGAGKTYVVFGKASGWTNTISLGTLDGTNGFELDGGVSVYNDFFGPSSLGDRSGTSVSAAGDVNNDGIVDILIGAPYAKFQAGKTYVVFGDSPPVLANNSLTIGADCTVTLDSRYLAAYDLNHANSTLMFTASNVINGNFQRTVGGVVTPTITSFPQSDITNGYIQFLSTNSTAPSYSMAVSSTGLAFVPATPAIVSFTVPCSTQVLTQAPTAMPTVAPSAQPTVAPTAMPTVAPTRTPTSKPTAAPTAKPTVAPTRTPTLKHSPKPTSIPPTRTPTPKLTAKPTRVPQGRRLLLASAPEALFPESSSASRTSPNWFLPISQAVSLLDSTVPAAYQSVSGYLSGLDASSQTDTHNASYTSPSLGTASAQLMLGAVALKLTQKGVNWAKGFWASKPALKAETAPALSEVPQSVQQGSDTVSTSTTPDLRADMKHLSEKMEAYQACLEETSTQSTNVVYPDFQKPLINFAYNAGTRKRTPSSAEQAAFTHNSAQLATLGL